jgi:hypothetical protein
VQNKFGDAADVQERAINLVTWADPAKTLVVVKVLAGALLVVLVIPFHFLLPLMQLAVGVKLFVIDAIFARSPVLRERFDNVGRFLRSLPTNAELDLAVLSPADPSLASSTSNLSGSASDPASSATLTQSDKAVKVGDALAAAGCLQSEETVLEAFRALHSGHPGRLCVTNRRVIFHHKT